jgi:hypothetical protein
MRLTMAVDDMVSAPAVANAQLNGVPIAIKMPIIESMVMMTCKPPKPNTRRRMALSLGRENSRPMLNIKNTMPISPK